MVATTITFFFVFERGVVVLVLQKLKKGGGDLEVQKKMLLHQNR